MNKKALILDFGGVISRTLFETHNLSEAALGLPKGSLKWLGPFDPKTDSLWQDMQNDKITERDYWLQRTHEVGTQVGQEWTAMKQLIQATRGANPEAIIRPEFLHALQILKSNGIKLAILSNELDLFYGTDFQKKLVFLKEFCLISDATYTEILKPDPRAYIDCLRQLKLKAKDCIFVDDQKRNIIGAQNIGLECVHFNVLLPKKSYSDTLKLLGLKWSKN